MTKYKEFSVAENKSEHNSWRAMKERVNNPKYWCYHRYGGRGISVCDSWMVKIGGFENFMRDMGKKPSPSHQLDRINTDGDYEPSNCRWVDIITQHNNTSLNRFETVDGITKTIANWCREYGIENRTVYNRMRDGKTFEQALKASAGRTYTKRPKPSCKVCGEPCKRLVNTYCGVKCRSIDRWRKG